MSQGLKKAGYAQGLTEVSSTAKEEVGSLRILKDGRKFRYAKAGASALAAGKLNMAAAIAAEVMDEAMPATSIGATTLTFTAGGSVTYAENYFKGGYLQINDETGEGHQYKISSSSAVSSGTAIYISLEDPIRVALTTSSLGTLVHSPWMAVVETATEENTPAGVSPIVVPANYYFWDQTSGPACCLCAGTPGLGAVLIPGGVAGSVTVYTPTTATASTWSFVGRVLGTAGVNTDYKPIMLQLD